VWWDERTAGQVFCPWRWKHRSFLIFWILFIKKKYQILFATGKKQISPNETIILWLVFFTNHFIFNPKNCFLLEIPYSIANTFYIVANIQYNGCEHINDQRKAYGKKR